MSWLEMCPNILPSVNFCNHDPCTDLPSQQTVNMDPLPPGESVPQSAVLISIIAVANIIWWMVMIAAVGLGATHLSRCPVQPKIPIFLIVFGAASLLSFSLTYTKGMWKQGVVYTLSSGCTALLHLFTFCWFIAGSTWVFSVYPPSYTPGEDRYCHMTTFQFAFAVITLSWVFLTLIFVCGCCFALLTCCRTVRARRHLTPGHQPFYGTISAVDERTAGDV